MSTTIVWEEKEWPTDGPLYLGPWTGEIGYELGSWIPFITWRFQHHLHRCVAISRGGNDSWYPCKVINAYDVVPPDEYRDLYQMRKAFSGEYKQINSKDHLDCLILHRLGLPPVTHCHPSLMFHRRMKYQRNLNENFFLQGTKPERWPGLPDDYIAGRFYVNDYLERPLVSVEAELPIVGLKPLSAIDNHDELDDKNCDILVEYGANESLSVISRVVAHSKKFLCTYGGLAWVGPKFGIPTIGFASCTKEGIHEWMEPFQRENL